MNRSPENSSCVFDDPLNFKGRIIHLGKTCFSVLSSPHFRDHHALVIPVRHAEHRHDLTEEEDTEYSQHVNFLTRRLAQLGLGYHTLVKHQPDQPENGIKMNHLHTHVFPRRPGDPLVATPEPNEFEGMIYPTLEQLELSRRFYTERV